VSNPNSVAPIGWRDYCSAVTVQQTAPGVYTFTPVATTTLNVSLSSYIFDFGDGSAPQVATSSSVSHTFAGTGKYTVQVTTNFVYRGVTDTEVFPACQKTVTVSTTVPTPQAS
jgi:hypothetical protein